MHFDRFSKRQEQKVDSERVKTFKIPITEFVEGKREKIDIADMDVQRDNMGKIRPADREALRVAVAEVRVKLNERYKPVTGMKKDSSNEEKGLADRVERLQNLEDQIAFAA